MNITDADRLLITPALSLLCDVSGRRMDTPEARVMLIAIGLQESRLQYRRQIRGPARGYWQFENGGGVRGVLQHHSSAGIAADVLDRMDHPHDRDAVYDLLEFDGVLAACFARLLLWTDPRALPAMTDFSAAWDTYIRNWRPGKPHPDTWTALHDQAREYVEATA